LRPEGIVGWKLLERLRGRANLDWRRMLEEGLRERSIAVRWLPGAGVLLEAGPLAGTSFDFWRLEHRVKKWTPGEAAVHLDRVAQLLAGVGEVRLERVPIGSVVITRAGADPGSPVAWLDESWLVSYSGRSSKERQLVAVLPREARPAATSELVRVFSDGGCELAEGRSVAQDSGLSPWAVEEQVVDERLEPEDDLDEVVTLVRDAALVADERSKLGGVPAWIQERERTCLDDGSILACQVDLRELGVERESRFYIFLTGQDQPRARFEVDVE
jgi:hypothetical protein